MGYSRLEYPYSGGSQDFAVNFTLGQLDQDDVTVYVRGEVDGLGDQLYRAFTWVNTGTVRVTDPLPNPCEVVIERTVSKSELEIATENTGDVTRSTLLRAFKQSMMALHEVLDGRIGSFSDAILDAIIGVKDEAQVARVGAEAAAAAAAQSAVDAAVFNPALYFLKAGDTITGNVTLTNSGSSSNRAVFAPSTSESGTFGWSIRAAYSGSAGGDILQLLQPDGSTSAARIDRAGTTMSQPVTVVTREKGDARYLQVTGGVVTGTIIGDASEIRSRRIAGSDAQYIAIFGGDAIGMDIEADAATEKPIRVINNSSAVGQVAQFIRGDSALVATVEADGTDLPGTASIVTRERGDVRYGVRTVSTSDPSGGSNGDIWFKVAP